jgi:nicotinamide-nucleotide amidase
MTDTKQQVLGVPGDLLAERGPVDAEVARAMAVAVRDQWAADLGLATTGVAGPDPQGGHPVGEVHIAVAGADVVVAGSLVLSGDRGSIRRQTVDAVLALVADLLAGRGGGEAMVGGHGYTEVTQGEERR